METTSQRQRIRLLRLAPIKDPVNKLMQVGIFWPLMSNLEQYASPKAPVLQMREKEAT